MMMVVWYIWNQGRRMVGIIRKRKGRTVKASRFFCEGKDYDLKDVELEESIKNPSHIIKSARELIC